ncbi:hypothetical protein [Mucilaginibacter sp. OK098]|uniref:hypothetical protein n=1 Tax=Mucilaginibacter sp. OK098 TaxID=1855297 RepID=UPI00092189AF|nr:hypothetical protein [Mucilaginibacter sp. OK098]SHM69819.1 hypothetical protein SAMN05216524_10391 [Mucilaginibacter sp. OK098]
MKWILISTLTLLSIVGCKKSSDLRRIPNGTKVKMDSNVKLRGSTAPFIVDSLYLQSNYDMNFYYCTDAGSKQWIIPDDDLIIIK